MKEVRFSLFEATQKAKGAFQTIPTKELSLTELLEYYNSESNKKLSEAILNANDTLQNKLKSERAYYTPSGTFTKRNNESIQQHNPVISIDIDGLGSKEEAVIIRDLLAQHKSILFCLLSTRGKGVKALMRVNATYTPNEQYQQLKHVFKPYLTEYLNIDAKHIDEAQFKLSQPCYFSYDSEMVVNLEAEPLSLNFNYSEPERKPFVPTKVNADSVSRIDKYILGAYNNMKLGLTTDNIHSQKAKIKGIKSLMHYAPHLEYLLDDFIVAIEGLYTSRGDAQKAKGARKDILQAWEAETSKNNSTIDGIIAEAQKNKVAQLATNVTEYSLKTKFIGQDKALVSLIGNAIKNNKVLLIGASVGKGKTNLFLNHFGEQRALFLVPTLAILSQMKKEGVQCINGDSTNDDVGIALNHKFVACTYASLHRIPLSSIEDRVMVIDEAHLIIDRSNIAHKQQQQITKFSNKAMSTVYLSATNNANLATLLDAPTINITSKREVIKWQPLYYTKGTTKVDAVQKFIQDNKSDKNEVSMVLHNNKEDLEKIKYELIRHKVYLEEEIAIFTANVSHEGSKYFTELQEEQLINDKVKVVLTTSKISEGVNINNDKVFNMLIVGCKDVNYFVQGGGRPRKGKVNGSVLISENDITRNGKFVNESDLYSELLSQISTAPIDSFKEETTLHLVNIDNRERCTFKLDGYALMVNKFELLYQAKRVKESFYNFELWSEDVKKLASYISFNEPIEIVSIASSELKENRKERKEVKAEILEKVLIKLCIDTDVDSVMMPIRNNTKNKSLKGFIEEVLYDFEEGQLPEDELRLVLQYQDKVERFIMDIEILMKLLGSKSLDLKNNFLTAANIYYEDDNYKPSNFSILCKRIMMFNLESKEEAYSFPEQKRVDSINTIKQVVNDYEIEGKIEISKDEMYNNLLRKKLKYRSRTENVATVKEKIGFCFNVEYDKKRKVFILTNIEGIRGTKRTSFYIEKKRNMVPDESLLALGLQPNF